MKRESRRPRWGAGFADVGRWAIRQGLAEGGEKASGAFGRRDGAKRTRGHEVLIGQRTAETIRRVEIDHRFEMRLDVPDVESVAMRDDRLMGVNRCLMFVLRSIVPMRGVEVGVRGHTRHGQHDGADEIQEK